MSENEQENQQENEQENQQENEQENEQDTENEQENEQADTFPREYVESLRHESKGYRTRAQDAESKLGPLADALWLANVKATDRLADPADLPIPADTDPTDLEAVTAAVKELLERKPHLAARRARGDVGQHDKREQGNTVSLASIMRAHA